MRKPTKIAIVGMGRWGNHLLKTACSVPGLDVAYVCARDPSCIKHKTDAMIISGIGPIIDDTDIDCVIIATQAEKHHETAVPLLKANKKVMIEKPLSSTSKYAKDIARSAVKPIGSSLMVADKYAYHKGISDMISFIRKNSIEIRCITSRWLKSGGIQRCGILLDIAYHHIYLFEHIIGSSFDSLDAKILNTRENIPTTGLVSLKFKDVNCSIEASYNNHYDHFQNSVRIETGKGTFMISEDDRKIKIFFSPQDGFRETFGYDEDKETAVRSELEFLTKWAEGHASLPLDPTVDLRIIEHLEKSLNHQI